MLAREYLNTLLAMDYVASRRAGRRSGVNKESREYMHLHRHVVTCTRRVLIIPMRSFKASPRSQNYSSNADSSENRNRAAAISNPPSGGLPSSGNQ